MPRKRFGFIGSKGLNTDVLPSSSEFESWSELSDVVALDGHIQSTYGELKKMDLPIKPLYRMTYKDVDNAWHMLISDGKQVYRIWIATGQTLDVTPVPAPTIASRVTIVIYNSVGVVNFENFGAFYLDSSAGRLSMLPGWQADWRCKAIAVYKYNLVALGMTEGGIYFQHKLRWSASAEDGAVPAEWIPAVTNDAGDDILGETFGAIVGSVLVRDYLYIVKEDAIYAMSYIGGQFIMRVDRMYGASGTKLYNGFVEAKGNIATCDLRDVRFFDGQQSISITDGRVRKALQELVKADRSNSTQLFSHANSGLLFIGSNKGTDPRIVEALIYDWVTDVWWMKKFNYAYGFAAAGLTGDDTNISEIIVFESNQADTSWWFSVLGASVTNSDATPKECSAVRVGMPLESTEGIFMVTEAWLDIISDIPLVITFGTQETPQGTIKWGTSEIWTPGVTHHVTPRVSGRYLALSITSHSAGTWKIGSIVINWEAIGSR